MSTCRQCGDCCRKSGPALHIEDKFLVMQGKLPAGDLFTLRKGEIALDPLSNEKIFLEEEIIKIRPDKTREWACVHLLSDNRCGIYEARPVECRLLKCWDPKALLARYQEDRLSRLDLFGKNESFRDLIEDHENRCSYEKIKGLAARLGEDPEAVKLLSDSILYDKNIREVLVEKNPSMEKLPDLLFGRPLLETLPPLLDLKIEKRDTGWVLRPKGIPLTN